MRGKAQFTLSLPLRGPAFEHFFNAVWGQKIVRAKVSIN